MKRIALVSDQIAGHLDLDEFISFTKSPHRITLA